MIKRVLALAIMATLFSFNCDKCGMAKKEEAKEQPAEQPAEGADAETKAPAAEEKK